MVLFLEICFWFFLFVVFYTYFGYGILVYIINKLSGANERAAVAAEQRFEPLTALVVAAYNEEEYIEDKIRNTLEIDYPADKLKIYFVTDGSDDATASIVARYPEVELLHQPERRGKASAMNRAMQLINEPFVIFCDANTMLNRECVREMVKPYADPRVGAVAGEKKILQVTGGKAASAGEGIYWKYESFLKRQDSLLYSVVGAAGELFSVRKELYRPIEKGVIIEDFVLSLRICEEGHVVKYAPGAFAMETASASVRDEQKRKVRICAGGFQAMKMLKGLLNFKKHGILTFQYVSHRVLRWTLTPVCLLLLLPFNAALSALGAGFVYDLMLVIQLGFYVLALTGWFYANRDVKVKSLYVPYYFLFMNVSVFLGFKRYIAGQQSVLWEKAARQKLV